MVKRSSKGTSGTFQLGDCIGKGAFGSVYSGLNLETGEVVAIKQIKLSNIPKSDLTLIMAEIDLLKELNHPNIVQYNGSVKAKDHLNIIMEYCENGSLLHIIKKYGNMPENLIGVYTTQILEGLQYLHEQGVMHRDIKAANILTTKSGQVKLADFGIACKVESMEKSVVGSPYWMAPEVIDLLGASTASDIWSLGCTLIELLQGHPPYYQLAAMTALFRIVQDDHPPFPEGCSSLMSDFLLECFQKDANLRVNAKKLLKHPWIINAKKKMGKNVTNPSNIGAEVAKANVDKGRSLLGAADISDLAAFSKVKNTTLNQGLPDSSLPQVTAETSMPNRNISEKYVDNDEDDDDWDTMFDERDLNKIPTKINDNMKKRAEDLARRDSLKLDSSGTNVDSIENFAVPVKKSTQDAVPYEETNTDSDLNKSTVSGRYLPEIDDDDDDFNDVFGAVDEKGAVDKLKRRIQNMSLREDVGDETLDLVTDDDDPFADIVEEFDDEDITKRDQQAWISSVLTEFLKVLSASSFSEENITVCTTVLDILNANHASAKMLITYHCVIPLIEALSSPNDSDTTPLLLKIVNKCCLFTYEFQESICLLGGIPTILKFTGKEYSLDLRREAAFFVKGLCDSVNPFTLQMFIACNGIPIFVKCLDTDYQQCKDLQFISIDGINKIIEMKSPTPRNDFCRIFVKEGLFKHVYHTLYDLNSDRSELALDYSRKLTNLLCVFSTGDSYVKRGMVADQSSLNVLISEITRFPPALQLDVMKCIKNISSDSETLDSLFNADFLRVLVTLMDFASAKVATELQSHIAHTLFNVCRISKERQTVAAELGVIPHLQQFVSSNSSMKQFALPILCEMAHASRVCRENLWASQVLTTYLSVLSDKYWQTLALDAIVTWATQKDEGTFVEDELLNDSNMTMIINAICSARLNLDVMLNSLHRLLIVSQSLCQYLAACPEFIATICKRLQDSRISVRLSLLKILTAVVEGLPQGQRFMFGQEYNLNAVLTKYSHGDSGVLVRESAKKVIALIV